VAVIARKDARTSARRSVICKRNERAGSVWRAALPHRAGRVQEAGQSENRNNLSNDHSYRCALSHASLAA
jgi:hypothetical protein